MLKVAKGFSHAMVVITSLSHIFCCGLPVAMSILGVSSALGVVGVTTVWESVLHEWETEILMFSGIMLLVGIILQYISYKIDCIEDAGCHHEPCAPKKRTWFYVLLAASLVYLVNVFVFFIGIHA